MSREWENRFSDIVRETEANLSKVRHRLNSSHHGVYDSYRDSRKPVHGYTGYRGRSSQYSVSPQPNYIDLHHHSSLTTPQQDSLITDQSPALVALLSEKIENQSKMIQALALQVKSVENDRDRLNNQVKQLHSDLAQVNMRLAENGVDLETERKLENLQREVKLELGDLQTQMKIQSKDTAAVNDDIVVNLMRDIADCKRYQQDDANTLRRDIESLRTRLIKLEIDLSGHAGEKKELSRRVDRVEKSMSEISSSEQRHIHELSRTTREKQQARTELNQLRSEMEQLQDSVNKLESDSFGSNLKNSNTNRKKQKKIAKRQRKKDLELLGSMTESSDNDLSSNLEENTMSNLTSNPMSRLKPSKTGDNLSLSSLSDLPDGDDAELLSSPSLTSFEIDDDLL